MLERRNDLEDFRAQCRRNLARRLEDRVRYGFCYTYKPVLDDAAWRSFDSTAEYRAWCRQNLPVYLGYGELDALQRSIINNDAE